MLSRWLARQFANPTQLWAGALARLWNHHNRALNDTALAALELAPGERALEIGFGGGYLLNRMNRLLGSGSLSGVDISPAMVAYCRRRFKEADLRCAAVDALPFPSGRFSKIVSVNSIFYWPEPAAGLAELRRVCCPGGRLVLVFTDRFSLQNRPFSKGGIRLFSGEEVDAMLKSAGYTPLHLDRHFDGKRIYWCSVSVCEA